MPKFIGYHIDDNGTDSVPVSTGVTKEEALGLAMKRVLSKCILSGSITVQERNEVDDETFSRLTAHLNHFFAEPDTKAA